MNNTNLHQQTSLFKALAHPVRLMLLYTLRDCEACVSHLALLLDLPQPYLSQQLAVLRDAGLLTDRRDGWNVYYRVGRPDVFTLLDAAWAMTGASPPQLDSASPHDCSCPRCTARPRRHEA